MIQCPSATWQSGQFHHIPWMTGVVQREGAVRAAGMFWPIHFVKVCEFGVLMCVTFTLRSFVLAIVTNKVMLDDLNTKLKDLVPKLMEIEFKSKSKSDAIYEKLKNYYLNGSDIVNEDNEQGFIDVSFQRHCDEKPVKKCKRKSFITDVFRSSFYASILQNCSELRTVCRYQQKSSQSVQIYFQRTDFVLRSIHRHQQRFRSCSFRRHALLIWISFPTIS